MTKVIEREKDEDAYEDMLNDIYGTVTVCGYEHDQGTLLREIDPTAFRCGLSDEPIEYECGECGEVFDDEGDAEECCEEEED